MTELSDRSSLDHFIRGRRCLIFEGPNGVGKSRLIDSVRLPGYFTYSTFDTLEKSPRGQGRKKFLQRGLEWDLSDGGLIALDAFGQIASDLGPVKGFLIDRSYPSYLVYQGVWRKDRVEIFEELMSECRGAVILVGGSRSTLLRRLETCDRGEEIDLVVNRLEVYRQVLSQLKVTWVEYSGEI